MLLSIFKVLKSTFLLNATSCTKNDQKDKFSVVFVVGRPGSGKGTQCHKIEKELNFTHVCGGDLLRRERDQQSSPLSDLIQKHMQEGTLVPSSITCTLIINEMKMEVNDKYVIDGFPRNKENLDIWNKMMDDKTIVMFMLFIDCSEDTCKNRCLQRQENRTDDNEKTLQKRFAQFNGDCMDVIKYFESQGLLRTIDGSGSIDEVFDDIRKLFETE